MDLLAALPDRVAPDQVPTPGPRPGESGPAATARGLGADGASTEGGGRGSQLPEIRADVLLSCPTGSPAGVAMVATKAVSEEARMATKDKGGKNTKQAASRTLKEKRQTKRDKKVAKVRGTVGTSRP